MLGKDLLIKEGANPIAGATTCNLSISADVLDVTAKGSGDWKESVCGMKSWSIDSDGLFELEEFSYIEKIGTEVTVEVSAEGMTYTGSALINDMKINSGTGDLVTYNLTMTGTGALSKKA